jgi:hypothetical protein
MDALSTRGRELHKSYLGCIFKGELCGLALLLKGGALFQGEFMLLGGALI